jgi:1,4-dihydroxy-2-naphthoate octaprenyltransferase
MPVQHTVARSISGVYRLADPKIMLASLVPFLSGMAIAHREGAGVPLLLLFGALAALFGVEVGKNAVNDLFDFRSGADLGVRPEERTPFSGGKRVLVDGLLTERQVVASAVGGFAFALLFGSYVAVARDPRLLLLGAAGAAISIAYTAPPLALAYRGFGEVAVFLAYGPGIVLGADWLFERRISPAAIWASLSLGALIANVLVVNEVPDERADREAGKRTWVVRLGRRRAFRLVAILFAFGFSIPVAGILLGQTPRLAGLLLGLPAAAAAIRELSRPGDSVRIVRVETATLMAYALAGAGLVAAMLAAN